MQTTLKQVINSDFSGCCLGSHPQIGLMIKFGVKCVKGGCHLRKSLLKLLCNCALEQLFEKIENFLISIKRSIYAKKYAAK